MPAPLAGAIVGRQSLIQKLFRRFVSAFLPVPTLAQPVGPSARRWLASSLSTLGESVFKPPATAATSLLFTRRPGGHLCPRVGWRRARRCGGVLGLDSEALSTLRLCRP